MLSGRQAGPRWLPLALILICLAPRLPGLNLPLLEEGHAWRQSVTAMLARNFERHGYRLWLPEIDVPPRGDRHAPGYTNSEFPLYSWLVALAWGVTGIHDSVARLISILCAVGATLCLWGLGRRVTGDWGAAVAAGWFAVHPLAIYFTRAVLPEPLMVLLIAAAMWAVVDWAETGSRRSWAIALVCATLAPMVKQPALHIWPALLVACWVGRQRNARAAALLLLPPLAMSGWYHYANELGRHYAGHFAVGGGSGLINPRLWLTGDVNFYPRLVVVMGVLIGCGTGWLLAVCALGRCERRGQAVVAAWGAGALVACLVANGATITHYYYNLALVPPLALAVGHGAGRWDKPRLRWIAALLALLGPLLVITFPEVPNWYSVRPGEVAAAAAVRRVSRPDDTIYTICYGTQLLYACDRRGEFLLPEPAFMEPKYLQQAQSDGFRYLVTGRRELLDGPAGGAVRGYLATRRLAAAGPGFVVYDLQQEAP